MWKPWQWAGDRFDGWARLSNASALNNARCAATDLSRARVERDEVELYLADQGVRGVSAAAAVRPA